MQQMVRGAIEALKEYGGSTESAISSYIQSNYQSLPWGHSKLLPYYLNKLIIAGEISTTITSSSSSTRYSFPNPNLTHPCRRRGRPPKFTTTTFASPHQYTLPNPNLDPPRRRPGRPPKLKRNSVLLNPQRQPPLPCSEQRESTKRRLILKLKKSNSILIDEQGGAYRGGWLCSMEDISKSHVSVSDRGSESRMQMEGKEEEVTAAATAVETVGENQEKLHVSESDQGSESRMQIEREEEEAAAAMTVEKAEENQEKSCLLESQMQVESKEKETAAATAKKVKNHEKLLVSESDPSQMQMESKEEAAAATTVKKVEEEENQVNKRKMKRRQKSLWYER